MENQTEEKGNVKEEKFRDSLATVSKEGKRIWIFPKKPKGKFYNARTLVSILLLAVLFGTPFIKVDGNPFILLDIPNRHFILFGVPFGPHDFHILAIAVISLAVFIILFTVVYGRVFCGWICPQTIFLEMVFRKIEYWIEGDSKQQRELKTAPMSGKKFFKKSSKHIIFYTLSFLIANTFLAYIVGIDRLFTIITDPPSQHLGGLTAIIFFSGAFYFVFSSFREQACTVVCPYGRFQGVLLDKDSIVISYDYKRGEPRGKIKKGVERNLGDCIDCHLCVDVCPTGIDIRNGTQLECVNCTACIDACDGVMDKVKRPKSLIKYASKNGIETGRRFRYTPRAIGYTIILFILLTLLTVLLLNRTHYDITILRTPGTLSFEQSGNKISNMYDFKILNKTYESFTPELHLKNIEGTIKEIGEEIHLNSYGIGEGKLLITIDEKKLTKLSTPIEIEVLKDGKPIDAVKTSFLGKLKKKDQEK